MSSLRPFLIALCFCALAALYAGVSSADPGHQSKKPHFDPAPVGEAQAALVKTRVNTKELDKKFNKLGDQRQAVVTRITDLRIKKERAKNAIQTADNELKTANLDELKAQNQLDGATAEYMKLVGGLSTTDDSGMAQADDDVLKYLLQSSASDATLVYAQAQSMLDQRAVVINGLKEQSNKLASATEQARLAKATREAALQQVKQSEADESTTLNSLRKISEGIDSKRASSRKKARRLVEKLLALDIWSPLESDSSIADLKLGDRIAALAMREFRKGVVEVPLGSNNSPDIARYRTATLGAGAGLPWCAYFISYIAARAGSPIQDGGRGEGSVDAVREWGQRQGIYTPAAQAKPRRGDFVVWGEHIGIVVRVADGVLYTVEGNSSQRVARRQYDPKTPMGYVRVANLVAKNSPEEKKRQQLIKEKNKILAARKDVLKTIKGN